MDEPQANGLHWRCLSCGFADGTVPISRIAVFIQQSSIWNQNGELFSLQEISEKYSRPTGLNTNVASVFFLSVA